MLALASAPTAAAEAITPNDEVIVKYRDAAEPAQREAARARAEVKRTLSSVPGVDARVVRVDGDPEEAARELERSAAVAYAEPNEPVHLAARRVPNDPLFGGQYGLDNRGQTTGGLRDADIDAPEGWAAADLGRFPQGGGTKVAIIDTGIDLRHPDLAGKTIRCAEFLDTGFREGRCSDDDGHGTHVAGIIAAIADNAAGIAGVAFNARLIVCRALQYTPFGTVGSTSDVAGCVHWVKQQGARVISMSIESDSAPETLGRALRRVWSGGSRRGAVLVAAAGNCEEFDIVCREGGDFRYPASFAEVISVSATDDRDDQAPFSIANRDVELAAPGVEILSTDLPDLEGNRFSEKDGTSQAAPHAAGIAAVLRHEHRSWKARKVRAVLRKSADDLGPNGRDPRFGFGRVNLCRAVGGSCD